MRFVNRKLASFLYNNALDIAHLIRTHLLVFKLSTSFCKGANRFVSNQAEKTEDRFSRSGAQMAHIYANFPLPQAVMWRISLS